MMNRILVMPLLILLPFGVYTDEEMRCDGKLIGLGRSRLEMLRYCGEPQDKISYLYEKVKHQRFSIFQTSTSRTTQLTGYYLDSSRNTVASSTVQHPKEGGGSRGEAMPTHTHEDTRIQAISSMESQTTSSIISSYWECTKSTVHVDEYTYNFGTGKFMTFVRFENGKVASIRFGEYGF